MAVSNTIAAKKFAVASASNFVICLFIRRERGSGPIDDVDRNQRGQWEPICTIRLWSGVAFRRKQEHFVPNSKRIPSQRAHIWHAIWAKKERNDLALAFLLYGHVSRLWDHKNIHLGVSVPEWFHTDFIFVTGASTWFWLTAKRSLALHLAR